MAWIFYNINSNLMPTSQRNSVKPPAAERNKIKRFFNFTAGNFTFLLYDLPLNYSLSP